MRRTQSETSQSASPHQADLNERSRHFADGPKPDINRTMPKSYELFVGQSANNAKKPAGKERDNKREEIGRCRRTKSWA